MESLIKPKPYNSSLLPIEFWLECYVYNNVIINKNIHILFYFFNNFEG